MHDRIVDGFREQGIGVTTAIGQCVSESLAECIAPLVAEVEGKKAVRNEVDRYGVMVRKEQPKTIGGLSIE